MEFIENPFEPKNETLKDLKAKIEKAGLSFHPYLAMQSINKEVERQATELVTNHFKGMKIEMLGKCNQEIKEYAEAEEKRYNEFQKFQKNNPGEILKEEKNDSVIKEIKPKVKKK